MSVPERVVTHLEVAGECDDKGCKMPMVRVTYGRGEASRTITVHDDGSWDGHPAWQADRQTDGHS